MITKNGIPLIAVLIELLIGIFILIVFIRLVQRYLKRRRKISLTLSLAFFFYGLSVLSSGVGKLLDFYGYFPSLNIHFSEIGVIVGYIFIATANIYIISFIDQLFYDEKKLSLTLLILLSSISIGLFIAQLIFGSPVLITAIVPIIYNASISLIIYYLIFYLSLKELRKVNDTMMKMGFFFISLYGLFLILTFLSFSLNIYLEKLQKNHYTPFYYLAWLFIASSVSSAYLGYVMPEWFKKLIQQLIL